MDKAIVLMNPSASRQPALAAAIDYAIGTRLSLHLHGDVDAGQEHRGVMTSSFDEVSDHLFYYVEKGENKGLDVTYSINSSDSDQYINTSVSHSAFKMIFKDYQAASWSDQLLHRDVHWMLEAACPVSIVKGNYRWKDMRLLVDLENRSDDEFHEDLFKHEMAAAKHAEVLGADVHYLVNHSDSLHYPDRGRLVRHYNIDNAKLISRAGKRAEVVCETAKTLGSTMILSAAVNPEDRRHYKDEQLLHAIMNNCGADLTVIH